MTKIALTTIFLLTLWVRPVLAEPVTYDYGLFKDNDREPVALFAELADCEKRAAGENGLNRWDRDWRDHGYYTCDVVGAPALLPRKIVIEIVIK